LSCVCRPLDTLFAPHSGMVVSIMPLSYLKPLVGAMHTYTQVCEPLVAVIHTYSRVCWTPCWSYACIPWACMPPWPSILSSS
jgi:hypothetical protein